MPQQTASGQSLRRPVAAGSRYRFVRAVLALLLACLWQGAALAQGNHGASPRAAAHDGFGRMVFDWSRPVEYSADVLNDDKLVVRFSRPIQGDVRNLVRPLSHYLTNAAISDDHRTATFRLRHPVTVKSTTNARGSVVVDMADAAAAPGLSPKDAAPPPPAAASGPGGKAAPMVGVRVGDHGSYSRLVFSWPKDVGYKVEKSDGGAVVSFAGKGRIDAAALKAALPKDMALTAVREGRTGTEVQLKVPRDARLRHFAAGSKVVLDVVRSDSEAARNGAGAAASNDVATPSLKPLGSEPKPQLPADAAAAEMAPLRDGKAPAALTAGAAPEAGLPRFRHMPAGGEPPPAKAAPVAATVEAEALPAAAPPPPPRDEKSFSLSVSWTQPAAAALFQRAGYWWLVFDRHQEVDTGLLRRLGGEALSEVRQLPSEDGTVLRMIIQPDYYPSIRQDGLLWVVDLTHHPAVPPHPIEVDSPTQVAMGTGILLSVKDAGAMIPVQDPEVGDTLMVVPVLPLGAGVYPGRTSPDVDLLATEQGIAMVPHADGLDVRSSRSGVEVGLPGGLALTPPQAAPQGHQGGYFNIPLWERSGPDQLYQEWPVIRDSLDDLPPDRKPEAHMEAAQYLFANGYAAEALGYLRIAAAEEPSLADTGPYHALRGACNALMERWDLALPDLDNPLVKNDPEALMWRAAAHAAAGDQPGAYDKALAAGLPLIRNYPKPLRWPLAAIIARSALAAADDATLQDALTMLDQMRTNPQQQGFLDYMHGAYGELDGQYDKAIYFYDKATKGDNREFRARAAMASAELELKLHRISPTEAADQLDRLRFAWRDENFEFNLLRRLAELELQSGDYAEALRSARSLVNNYPDNPGAPAVTRMMQDTFKKLYLDGGADALPPVSAIALYDEFRDLTPTGAEGDEMIRKLADRLASVDLLDRAADLLQHQVEYRLQGLDKARVGAQLALLDLLNKTPQAALQALQSSAMDGLPADLVAQRRHLQARALADLDRVPEAVQLLANDTSREGGLLRAEIYWRKQDWPQAAAAFEGLVPRPTTDAPLDDASARLVLSWATALTLANDDRGLASLRRAFGTVMAKTPYNNGFVLLTSPDRGIPDVSALSGPIKQAEDFMSFIGNYHKQVAKGGLSKIN